VQFPSDNQSDSKKMVASAINPPQYLSQNGEFVKMMEVVVEKKKTKEYGFHGRQN